MTLSSSAQERNPSPNKSFPPVLVRSIRGQSGLVESLTRRFTCCDCGEFLSGLCFASCQRDHLFCWGCHLKSERCLICRASWRDRCRLAEEVLDLLRPYCLTSCKNKKYGCKARGFPCKMTNHQEKCLVAQCPAIMSGTCDWVGLERDLTSHIESADPCCAVFLPPTNRGIACRQYSIPLWIVPHLRSGIKHYLLRGISMKIVFTCAWDEQGVIAFLRLCCKPRPDPDYTQGTLQADILGAEPPVRLSYTGEFHDVGVPEREIRASGAFLFVPWPQIAHTHLEIAIFSDPATLPSFFIGAAPREVASCPTSQLDEVSLEIPALGPEGGLLQLEGGELAAISGDASPEQNMEHSETESHLDESRS